MTQPVPPVETLTPAVLARLLGERKLLLIDVREPAEFAAERIQGAFLYPLSTFDAAHLPMEGALQIVFQCGTGKRSLAAAEKLRAAGRSHVVHLGGGLAAWKSAGLPIIPSKPAT